MSYLTMVTTRGLEPRLCGLKGRRVSQFHYVAIKNDNFLLSTDRYNYVRNSVRIPATVVSFTQEGPRS